MQWEIVVPPSFRILERLKDESDQAQLVLEESRTDRVTSSMTLEQVLVPQERRIMLSIRKVSIIKMKLEPLISMS
jgi:hypothetical protein